MKNKLCMVDFDGTLCNTTKINYHAYKQALNDEGFDISYDYYSNECNGKDYREFIPPIVGNDIKVLRSVHSKKVDYYKKYINQAILNNDLVSNLKKMKDDSYIALVTTATRANCTDILKHFDIEGIFDLIITKEDVANTKPNPEGYLKAMHHFNVSRNNCIIYEDSKQGIEAAKRAKVKFVVVKGYN